MDMIPASASATCFDSHASHAQCCAGAQCADAARAGRVGVVASSNLYLHAHLPTDTPSTNTVRNKLFYDSLSKELQIRLS